MKMNKTPFKFSEIPREKFEAPNVTIKLEVTPLLIFRDQHGPWY
jgi:hypothetical protein